MMDRFTHSTLYLRFRSVFQSLVDLKALKKFRLNWVGIRLLPISCDRLAVFQTFNDMQIEYRNAIDCLNSSIGSKLAFDSLPICPSLSIQSHFS